MSDVKINKKYICGDNEFKVTTGDKDAPSEYYSVTHDATNLVAEVGLGSQVDSFDDAVVLNDDAYLDLPANSAGFGTIQEYSWPAYVRFYWDTSNNVVLIENTTNVDNADTDDYLCIFDNTSSVRIRNRLGYIGRFVIKYNYTETVVAPTFKAFSVPSGVDNLDPSLTINGTTVTPTLRYKGGDADATDWDHWGYGEVLPIGGSGTASIFNDGSPGLGPNDDSIKFNEGNYYQASGSSFADLTTEDLVVEIVIKRVDDGSEHRIMGKRDGGVGWRCNQLTSGNLRVLIQDAGGYVSVATAVGSILDGAWHHIIWFLDRSGSGVAYVDGVAGTPAVISAVSGTCSNSENFTIGASSGGAAKFHSNIAYLSMWQSSSWLDTHLQVDVAAERFAKFCGYFPQVYTGYNLIVDGDMETAGTAAWTASDATLSKDSTAPLYQGTQHLRVTSTANTFYASQSILQIGAPYRVTGAARSVSGSAIPVVYNNGVQWTGTTSTSWQEFDVTFTASAAAFLIGSNSVHPGVVDFDNVSVTRVNWIPETKTRAYAAYLDKVEGDYRKLYYVSSEWLRMCHRVDSNAESIRGYFSENQVENLSTYFEDFSSWTKYVAGDVITDDVIAGPDGETKACSYVSDNTTATHFIYRAMTHPAATTLTASIYAKPGNLNWIYIYMATIGSCYFDVANGVVGTASGAVGYIEGPFYNGFYRCIVVYTGDGASHGFRVYPAEADEDSTLAGDGVTVNTYFWGGQVEIGDYATSPIKTVGAALTRLKDDLRYVAGDNIGGEDIGQGTMTLDFLLENYDSETSKYLGAISDGGASVDLIALRAVAADTVGGLTRASGGNNGDVETAGDLVNGVIHEVRLTWETDDVNLYADGDLEDTDSSATMPDDMDRLMIGSSYAVTLASTGIVSNFRIYAEPTTKG